MNTRVARGLMAILILTASGLAAARDASAPRPTAPPPTPSGITLVSTADPACEGGFGFRRAEPGARSPAARFVVPDDTVLVADEIHWKARASAFSSTADRVVLEIGVSAQDSGAKAVAPRAIVGGTRAGAGETLGERRYRSGIAFESGATLCGYVRTRDVLADAHAARAAAVIRGTLEARAVASPTHPDHAL